MDFDGFSKKKIGPYSWESQPQVATFQPKLLEKSYSSEFLWSEKKMKKNIRIFTVKGSFDWTSIVVIYGNFPCFVLKWVHKFALGINQWKMKCSQDACHRRCCMTKLCNVNRVKVLLLFYFPSFKANTYNVDSFPLPFAVAGCIQSLIPYLTQHLSHL